MHVSAVVSHGEMQTMLVFGLDVGVFIDTKERLYNKLCDLFVERIGVSMYGTSNATSAATSTNEFAAFICIGCWYTCTSSRTQTI